MNQYPQGPQQPTYGQPPAQPGPYTQYPPNGQPGYPPPGYPQGQPPYPQGQPPMQQPQAQEKPKKKKNKLAIGCGSIVALIVLVAIISAATHSGSSTPAAPASSGGSSNTTTPAPPAAPQTWQTTHTYSGNGSQKTETIAVADDWKIQWTCDPTSFMGSQYNVAIEVDNSDNTIADPGAVNTICSATNSSGSTEEHSGGNVYLNITSEAKWSVTIQELK